MSARLLVTGALHQRQSCASRKKWCHHQPQAAYKTTTTTHARESPPINHNWERNWTDYFRLAFINVGIVHFSLPSINSNLMQALLTLTVIDYGIFSSYHPLVQSSYIWKLTKGIEGIKSKSIGTILSAELWCCRSSLLGSWEQSWMCHHFDAGFSNDSIIPASWYSFCWPRKDDRLSQPHLVLIQQPSGIWTQDPRILSPPPLPLSREHKEDKVFPLKSKWTCYIISHYMQTTRTIISWNKGRFCLIRILNQTIINN